MSNSLLMGRSFIRNVSPASIAPLYWTKCMAAKTENIIVKPVTCKNLARNVQPVARWFWERDWDLERLATTEIASNVPSVVTSWVRAVTWSNTNQSAHSAMINSSWRTVRSVTRLWRRDFCSRRTDTIQPASNVKHAVYCWQTERENLFWRMTGCSAKSV